MAEIITMRPGATPAVAAPSDGGLGNIFSLIAKQFLDPNAAYRAELTTAAQNKNRAALMAQDALSGGLDKIDFDKLALPASIGAVDPRKGLGNLLAVRNANTYGYKDPRTTNALVGVGEDYGTTYQGTSDKLQNARTIQAMQEATKRKVNDALPVNVLDPETGLPTIRRRADAIGMSPAIGKSEMEGALLRRDYDKLPSLPPAQQKVLGAEPTADKILNWVDRDPVSGQVRSGRTLDGGKTDAGSGQPLPPSAKVVSPLNAGGANSMIQPPGNLSASNSDKLVLAREANRKLVDVASRMHDMASKDPSIVGAAGNIQRGLQDAFDAGTGIATVFGSREAFQKEFANAREKLIGVPGIQNVPGLDLNPNASNIVKLNTLLRYYAASALAGQSGRELSDKDVKQAAELVGDPSSWLQGPTRYLTGLEAVIGEGKRNLSSLDAQLNSNNIRGGQGAQPSPAAAPATRIRIDAQGNIIQ